MAVLALNDHVFKWAYPGWFTGKLSDFMGLIFFPVILDRLIGSRRAAILLTGGVFVFVKASHFGNDLWNSFFSKLYRLAGFDVTVGLRADATDLIALSALLVPTLWIAPFPKRTEVQTQD
jgi:hypothetical protein